MRRSLAKARFKKVVKMPGEPEKKFGAGLKPAKNGNEFRSISLTKSYQKDGEWKNSNPLGMQDIDKAIQVLQEAKVYLNED